MTEEKLKLLIARSEKFQAAVHSHVRHLIPLKQERCQVAFQASLLSLDHAAGALLLISRASFPSAYALMRPQYESLVRGIWLLHAASDTWVEKLRQPLTLEGAKRADKSLMLADMLKELEGNEAAPAEIVEQLNQFKAVTWEALNSYAHGGFHPLSRTLTGYPEQLTYDAVRNSNAVVALAAQLASILSGDPRNMGPVRQFHVEYSDCLPLLNS